MTDVITVNQVQQVTVASPPSGSIANGTATNQSADNSGASYVTPLHGPYYAASLAGRVFVLATGAAGTTIPVQATNLVSTFTLSNPIASNVNLELLSYELGILNATTVVASIDLYYQTNGAALSSTTPLTIRPALAGGQGVSVCTGYSAATYTNTVGTNFFRWANLTTFGAVTTTNAQPITVDLTKRGLIVPPNTTITVAGSAAQTQAMTQTLTWAEWPLPR